MYELRSVFGCFYKLGGVLFVGVLVVRILGFGVYIQAAFFGNSHVGCTHQGFQGCDFSSL